jgi:hypothetical protein
MKKGEGRKESTWTTLMYIYYISVRVIVQYLVPGTATKPNDTDSQAPGLTKPKGSVGDSMKTPTIPTGGVLVPDLRLRLGQRTQ